MVARYRIRDPGAWQFYGPNAEDVLRVEVTAAMMRSIGEMGVDRVLSDGRKNLIALAARRAQAGLDASRSGLELSSLELTRLSPAGGIGLRLLGSAELIHSGGDEEEGGAGVRRERCSQASAQVDASLQAARAAAASDLAIAKGDAEAFRALDREYRANPVVVRERLYRDGIEQAIAATHVRWVPPPMGGSYHGLRITVGPPGSASSRAAAPGGEPEFQ